MPVRGADLVLMAQHSQWTDARVSNNTALVVHLDGRVDAARLSRALDRYLDGCPWPAARLERPFPWGKLRWTAGARTALVAPPVHHRSARDADECHRIVEADLNDAIDPRREPPLRFTVIDVGDHAATSNGAEHATAGGVLVITWFHPLMDPRGGQNLLAQLTALDTDAMLPPDANGAPPGESAVPTVAPVAHASLRERGRIARRSLEYMRTLAPLPPLSPGARVTNPGPVRFRHDSFVERDAAAARGTREIAWRLAVVGKAMTELMRRRGAPDVPFLLPIAVDLRPKGEAGPTFGNMLAFHFARFRPEETADVTALARALRQQMADAVRDGQIDANAVAMEFLQYRPLSMMLSALPWTARGDIFSFNCADVSDFPAAALAGCLGRRVVNAYHVPCVLPRPGIGVFFNRCAGVNNVVVSWVDGAVAGHEAARVAEVVGEEMAWVRAS